MASYETAKVSCEAESALVAANNDKIIMTPNGYPLAFANDKAPAMLEVNHIHTISAAATEYLATPVSRPHGNPLIGSRQGVSTTLDITNPVGLQMDQIDFSSTAQQGVVQNHISNHIPTSNNAKKSTALKNQQSGAAIQQEATAYLRGSISGDSRTQPKHNIFSQPAPVINVPTLQQDDAPRCYSVANQANTSLKQIVVPVVPKPTIGLKELQQLSSDRASKMRHVAKRIIEESKAVNPGSGRRSKISHNAQLLSMNTLKEMSRKRARERDEIAAKIMAEGQNKKCALTPSNNSVHSCPAKKMDISHNRNNAYFVIKPDTNHGTALVCSHALCRMGRTKFVYCKFCEMPVSRMKFDERHAHPEQLLLAFAGGPEDGAAGVTADEKNATKEKGKTSS